MTDDITRADAWRYAREQAALLLDTDLAPSEVAEAGLNLASAFRDLDTGTAEPASRSAPGAADLRHALARIDISGFGEDVDDDSIVEAAARTYLDLIEAGSPALTAELQAQPMGWLPQELAGNTTSAVIRVEKHSARSRKTTYYELVLIDPHDGQPARVVITDSYNGHSVAWNLPEGLRLVAVPAEDGA